MLYDEGIALLDPPMSDEQGQDKKSSEPSTGTARIYNDLLEYARIVCAHAHTPGGRRLKLTEYLDSILRPAITRDHAATLARVAEGQRPKPKRTKDGGA